MKNKPLSLLLACLLLTAILFSAVLPAGALPRDATQDSAAPQICINNETGYKALIIDEDMLLTEHERTELIEDMKALTAYGNVAFWTTAEYHSNEIEQARQKRKELFGMDSGAIFVINMKIRKLTIQSYGLINQYLTDSKARSITDNVKSYATNKQYYLAARNAFAQMYDVVRGEVIPEPMKYTSYAVLALLVGMLAVLTFTLSKYANPLIEDTKQIADSAEPREHACSEVKVTHLATDKKYGALPTLLQSVLHIIFTSGGGGGGGRSSGSSGCSSGCSSGSSGCGGGGCGSGGSSSF